jgi:hypothetical protein
MKMTIILKPSFGKAHRFIDVKELISYVVSVPRMQGNVYMKLRAF